MTLLGTRLLSIWKSCLGSVDPKCRLLVALIVRSIACHSNPTLTYISSLILSFLPDPCALSHIVCIFIHC